MLLTIYKYELKKLFYANPDDGNWDDFEADVTNALAGFLPTARCPHAPFPQDVAEIGWSGLGTNGNGCNV